MKKDTDANVDPQDQQLQNDAEVVSPSFTNLYYFSCLRNCQKKIASQTTISGISKRTTIAKLRVEFLPYLMLFTLKDIYSLLTLRLDIKTLMLI